MLKRIATDIVQPITIGQLGRSQCFELGSIGLQFEFGSQGHVHASSITYLHQTAKKEKEMNEQMFVYPDTQAPEQGTPHSSPQLKLGASCGGFG
jgi:hypothetical protein